MPKYRITGPDGGTYEVTAPDGASEQDVLAYVQRNAGMVKAEAPEMKPSTPPPISPRQAEDESMAKYEDYKNSPEATLQSAPKWIRVPLQTLRDSVTGIGQGATANFADEIQGVLGTPLEMIKNGTLDVGGSYDKALEKARANQKVAETRSPIANTVGQVAGGMAAGGKAQQSGLTFLNAAKPTMTSMAIRGGLEGAGYGGLYGFGKGEGTEDRVNQAVTGAGLGAATGGVLGGISGKMAQRAADATVPTTQQLKSAANQAYSAADQAGLEIAPKAFSDAVDDIAILMQKEGMDKTIHPKALAALQRLTEAQGGTPRLSDIDTLRRVVKSAAASNDASERRLANMMVNKLDDFVNNLKPSDVVAGDAVKATSALNKARDLWSRSRKSEIIEEAVTKAQNRAASTGSGGNADNAIRQNIRAILDSPKKSRGFSQDERDLMLKVVRGGPVQNLMRLVGKLSPSGNGLMAALSIGATAHNPLLAVAPAAGMVSKSMADQATGKTVDTLLRTVRSGGSLPVPQMLPAQQRALLQATIANSPRLKGLLDYEQVPVR